MHLQSVWNWWCTAFSIFRGKKEETKAVCVMNTSFSLVCVSAILLMMIGLVFAHPLLVLFGASDTSMIYAYPYMMIYLTGTLPSMIAIGMNTLSMRRDIL